MRAAVIEGLGAFGKQAQNAAPDIVKKLNDPSPEVRAAAVLALARIPTGAEGAQKALAKLADDPDENVRANVELARLILGEPDPKSIPALITAMQSKDSVRAKLARGELSELSKIAPDKVVPVLLEVLKNKDERARRYALSLFARMRKNAITALPDIVAVYDTGEPRTRIMVLSTVMAMDTQGDKAKALILKGLKDKDGYVRREALVGALRYRDSLDMFSGAVAETLKDKKSENRWLAFRVLGLTVKDPKKRVEALTPLLKDPDKEIREFAIQALSSLRSASPEVVHALESPLKDGDANVRIAAVKALTRLGFIDARPVVPALVEGLRTEKDQQVKGAISRSLKRLVRSGKIPPEMESTVKQ